MRNTKLIMGLSLILLFLTPCSGQMKVSVTEYDVIPSGNMIDSICWIFQTSYVAFGYSNDNGDAHYLVIYDTDNSKNVNKIQVDDALITLVNLPNTYYLVGLMGSDG